MCGRFANTLSLERMRQAFHLAGPAPDWLPSWNIAPRQPVAVVRRHPVSHDLRLDLLLWGLVPNWAHDMGRQPINARAETVATSGMFRAAFRSRRCLVPATAYYEWQSGPPPRQPWAFARRDGQPLALAAIWESWEYEGDILRSFAIVTTQANAATRTIHDRMPVIIADQDRDAWFGAPPAIAAQLLVPAPADMLRAWRVGAQVNNVRHNGPDLLVPVAENLSHEEE
ncbi:SOS response-associated peptidase [Gluconacetobacter sp. Hr-1-5]|uniref:SOS response-associated peptidase n=1 Tax=Gluconacetobacter sp. Hr-1-5 TaxID=3395370 RepID=UPI003B52871E